MPMNVAGSLPKNLHKKYQFGIEINGFNAALFSKGKWPSIEFEESSFNSAGSPYPRKSLGRAKFEDLTFEKGISPDGADTAALDWLKKQINLENGTLGSPDEYERDVDLVNYDVKGVEFRRVTLHGACIKKHEGDDHEGGSSDHAIEKITIMYQYFTTK